jgi:hypothetical protein
VQKAIDTLAKENRLAMPLGRMQMFEVPEHFDEAFGALPPRSRLISLKPYGQGTLWQEALSSLLVRIARVHTCNPLTLLNREILPTTAIHHQKAAGGFVSLHIKPMNGVGKYAAELVRRLEELTLQEGLQHCTFLPWANIIDPHACGLLHKEPHWCKACFAEWRKDGKEPYFPLLWMGQPVEFCPKHGDALSGRCACCRRPQPFIPKHNYLDHCSHCGGWLGAIDGDPPFPSNSVKDIKYANFKIGAISEMIANKHIFDSSELLSQFKARLKATAQDHYFGNVALFERLIGFRRKQIRDWINRDIQPSIPLLLNLTYRLGVTPIQFLQRGVPEDFNSEMRVFVAPKVYEKRKVDETEIDSLRRKLQLIIESGVSNQPMKTVAESLGYTYTFVKYWLTEECMAISELHRNFKKTEAERRRTEEIELTKSIVHSLYEQRLRITRRLIDSRLREKGIMLSRPEIRETVKLVQASLL